MTVAGVLPRAVPLTEDDARELLAKGILPLSQALGPTRLAKVIGCNEKTVRAARDEQTTLSLDTAFNLLLADPTALNPLLRHFGLHAVAIDTDEDAAFDEVARHASEFTHVYLAARDPRGPGGDQFSHCERRRLRDVMSRMARPLLALLHRRSA